MAISLIGKGPQPFVSPSMVLHLYTQDYSSNSVQGVMAITLWQGTTAITAQGVRTLCFARSVVLHSCCERL